MATKSSIVKGTRNGESEVKAAPPTRVLDDKVNEVFANFNVDVLYATSDDVLFFREDHAAEHTVELEDKTIKTIKRK